MTTTRRSVYINHETGPIKPASDTSLAQAFHQQLPAFARTPLISLEDIAQELGVRAVYIKDESNRLGLPSFKILGASWGTYRAITTELHLPADTHLNDVAKAAQTNNLSLYAATEGNHGRAVAAMARILGIPAQIYVPSSVDSEAVTNIASEGAKVIVSNSHYDDAVLEAWQASKSVKGGLLIQDNAFAGYEQIPAWDRPEQQVADYGLKPTLMVTPVGVGSLAHAVVSHCKSEERHCAVLSVEPDTAPCLWTSLTAGKPVTVHTSRTIMEGLNCGTVSLTAFDDLCVGIDASATVSDFEAHEAVKYLQMKGVKSGPCGGATVAAFRRLAQVSPRPTYLSKDAVVVLLNTEGPRNYKIPLDVSTDDPVTLTQILTSIDSSNPDLSKASGAGEGEIAHYVSAWLQHRNFEAHWLEERRGRPSVVGVLRGSGGGNQSCSTGMLTPSKSSPPLRGDVILAAVADEENFSIGTEEVIKAGWRADAAIIPEPTNQEMAIAHKGFIWVEIDILGVAAHGSKPEDGVDAILLAGAVQTALLEYSKSLPSDPRLGKASLHAGLIQGGEEPSSYPERCTLTVEFRTVPAQTKKSILEDIESILSSIAKSNPDFKYAAPRMTFSRPSLGQSPDDEFIKTFVSATSKCLGKAQEPVACSFWCDAALLNAISISSVVYGPKSFGIHGKEEWVSVSSIREVASVMETVIRDFCA
ncbi:uncharacterized protein N0V96_010889 [Colletotrichum fioriniae]|uniref:uncharacterized protein n=1 Tax=Colletotrichum fioriniae TaxID=710243 RepID=UPI0032DA8DCC|nr:hypothetical protein N0V96_010889 [Colletotrichum fioriniae]